MQETQDLLEWEKYLRSEFEKLGLLDGDDLNLYLILLKSQKDLTGNELEKKLTIERTHVYSILNRLQGKGWIQLINPGTRPALYRGINPNKLLENIIVNKENQLNELKELQDYISKNVVPALSAEQSYGGRISNTFIIPTASEMHNQITEHVNKAKERIMFHISYDLFQELKNPIFNSLNSLFKNFEKNKIRLRDEDRRDHFAMIITGAQSVESFQDEIPERLKIIFDPRGDQMEILVFDDVVFINNTNFGFGVSLRISDRTVATTYAVLLSQSFLEKEIELYSKVDLKHFKGHMTKEDTIMDTIQSLFNDGWKTIPEHTNTTDRFDELGLASPGSERAFLRLCGIRYFPFTKEKSKREQVQDLFEDSVIRGLAYIKRLKKQFDISGKKDKMEMHDHECLIYLLEYQLRPEWESVIGKIPNLTSLDDRGKGAALATFNFKDKAAMCVWAINPNNVSKILEVLLKKF